MIMRVEGAIALKKDSFVVVDVAGVGYKIFVSMPTLASLGLSASLWTHMAVRENSMELFGFLTEQELSFFEMLIGVSGVGPKSALGITGVTSIESLKRAIAHGDISHLTGVSGIGKKTAEKIVLELKDKLLALGFSDESGTLREESDTVEALVSLGYSRQEARNAMQKVSADTLSTNDKIKEALKYL